MLKHEPHLCHQFDCRISIDTRRNVKSWCTSTRAACLRGIAPTMEGETATSLAPAIMAASVHPNLNCKVRIQIHYTCIIMLIHRKMNGEKQMNDDDYYSPWAAAHDWNEGITISITIKKGWLR